MPRKRLAASISPEACLLCGSEVDDVFLFGKLFHVEGVSIHQNCMFFSSGLIQNGAIEHDGILGFLLPDIKREVLRGKKLNCAYCKKRGATVGCCEIKCRKTFHFPCSIKDNSLHQHYKKFKSYCAVHKPKQNLKETAEDIFCGICFSPLLKDEPHTYLQSPCCTHNLFHRTCLQEYAFSAGRYFFKCPMCNNTAEFVEEMLLHGICIPEQDASWELEENAYQDLLQRPECGAINCDCKDGRKFSGKGEWTLLPCSICGSKARHKFCQKLEKVEKSWKCNECTALEDKITESKHPEVFPKETEDAPMVYHPASQSSSKSILSSESSLKSITNTFKEEAVIKTISPVIPESIPSEILEISQAASKFKVKRKKSPKDQPRPSKIFAGLQSLVAPLESMKSKICLLCPKQNAIKPESSGPYIVKCSSDKCSQATEIHQPKPVRNTSCCSKGSHNSCIKRMFGYECHNYRV